MRTAANILSSAPAMQIRYLDTMQTMAKSANSKVIFLPAPNQTMSSPMQVANDVGEGPSSYRTPRDDKIEESPEFGKTVQAHVVSNI